MEQAKESNLHCTGETFVFRRGVNNQTIGCTARDILCSSYLNILTLSTLYLCNFCTVTGVTDQPTFNTTS